MATVISQMSASLLSGLRAEDGLRHENFADKASEATFTTIVVLRQAGFIRPHVI